jgi:ParB-like chromosome segregation protein Spo0J
MMSGQYQLMPALTEDEYQALKADIQERGIVIPIEIDESGCILDGHHRLKAWQELRAKGVELPDYPRVIRGGMTEEQKRNHVRALNLLRRHLTRGQLQEQWAAMRADGMKYQEIADASGVSYGTVHNSLSKVTNSENQPAHVTGTDGKKYPAKKKRRKKKTPPKAAQISIFTDSDVGEEKAKKKAADPEPSDLGVHFSSEKADTWTPQIIIDAVLVCLEEIDLDPCSNLGKNHIPAQNHFSIEDDGLSQEWHGRIYMNPPYGHEIKKWTEKLCQEHTAGRTIEAIALVPARTDTQWWLQLRDFPVCFVTGRLKFVGNVESAPFPSAVFYLGEHIGKFYRAFDEVGDCWQRMMPGISFGE